MVERIVGSREMKKHVDFDRGQINLGKGLTYNYNNGKYTYSLSSTSINDDWKIDYGYNNERVIHTQEGITIRCEYCNRRCPSDEYVCAGCGALT